MLVFFAKCTVGIGFASSCLRSILLAHNVFSSFDSVFALSTSASLKIVQLANVGVRNVLGRETFLKVYYVTNDCKSRGRDNQSSYEQLVNVKDLL